MVLQVLTAPRLDAGTDLETRCYEDHTYNHELFDYEHIWTRRTFEDASFAQAASEPASRKLTSRVRVTCRTLCDCRLPAPLS